MNPRAIRFMGEQGIDLSAQRSKGLDELPAGPWDNVVTMGCGDACPHLPARAPAGLGPAGSEAPRRRGLPGGPRSHRVLVQGLIDEAAPDGSAEASTED